VVWTRASVIHRKSRYIVVLGKTSKVALARHHLHRIEYAYETNSWFKNTKSMEL
jgi:hypothetical protein